MIGFSTLVVRNNPKFPKYSALLGEYSKKSLFKNWDEYSLKNYVKYGTTKQGNGIKLACSPELESQIFAESENTFLSNHIISLKTPTYIFSAQYGSPPSSKSAIWRSKYVIAKTRISGANHFFPVERAATFSEMIIELLC